MNMRWWCALVFFVGLCAQVVAQLSPGDLSRFHAELEGLNNCTQCHELRKDVSNDLCLKCHTALASRITANSGYHSSENVKDSDCASCHSEHLDRDFELVYWKDGKEIFDHSKTGWPLLGAHARAGCQQCHTPLLIAADDIRIAKNLSLERTYLGLGTACVNCHADEHQGQLGANCIECHSQNSWKPADKFAHDRSEFPLTAKHAEVQCAKCHKNEELHTPHPAGKILKSENTGIYSKYKGLEFQSCTPCHRDVHENKFGSDCASCHTTSGFHQVASQKFDHSKTGYPLAGMHRKVDCAKCHTSDKATDPVVHTACANCHLDFHRGQFAGRVDGGACASCHTVDGFLPAQYTIEDHNKGDYPLTGSHLAIPCFICHQQIESDTGTPFAQFIFDDQSCKGCHEDIHRGQLDKYISNDGCEYCHNTSTWHQVSFDHSKTQFPLIGRHESTECMKCHTVENQGTEQELIRMSPLALECVLCHADPHNSQFLHDASEISVSNNCHTPESWKKLLFDHNRDAQWALDGAHANLACSSCHPTQPAEDGKLFTLYKPLDSACADCHTGEAGINR